MRFNRAPREMKRVGDLAGRVAERDQRRQFNLARAHPVAADCASLYVCHRSLLVAGHQFVLERVTHKLRSGTQPEFLMDVCPVGLHGPYRQE